MPEKTRNIFIKRLSEDLIGPASGEREEIDERPIDRYLTGILYPQTEKMTEEDDEKLEIESGNDAPEADSGADISINRSHKPASAGISFSLRSDQSTAGIVVDVGCGLYTPYWVDGEDMQYTERPNNKKTITKWARKPIAISLSLDISIGIEEINLTEHGLPNIFLYIKASKFQDALTVTVQIYNNNTFDKDSSYYDRETATLFQLKLRISTQKRTFFSPRPVHSYISDDDTRIAALIYRNTKEYAIGHTCSAIWIKDGEENISHVETEWIPQQKVYSVESDGDSIFAEEFSRTDTTFPSANFISNEPEENVLASLDVLVNAFDKWLDIENNKVKSLPKHLKKQAQKNINEAKNIAVTRMKSGISLLGSDKNVYKAFQLANKAMQIQAAWKSEDVVSIGTPGESILKWRPFQIAFALMSLHSLVDKNSSDRNIMDLIWFPTGGGKTEAYLLLTAFTLFYRRINTEDKISGYGVTVFMRYTLRTLTIQQFERAASLVTACEVIRKSAPDITCDLGAQRFSIGLWVGENSTPNKYEKAVECIENNNQNTSPAQIEECPVCHCELNWQFDDFKKKVIAICSSESCRKESRLEEIPVITVDDQIYSELPSLVIGTVDKFAQIVRQKNAVKLFGVHTPHNPPDLIIQDELHLISGPLGTMTGIYETAIDKFCSLNGYKPKIIGSTATIRKAKEQVNSLFDRDVYQFPPPIIDAENSCFAKTNFDLPGRIYIGITTAGRSQKFALQAVAASLLQSLQDKNIGDNEADNYSTLVAYFNSLKILGGALVVMQDDVDTYLKAYASRHGEEKRIINAPEEMTSRKNSKEIPQTLTRLKRNKNDPDFIDVLLATNMLSVGVDIPRLGLMLVTGQPKTMSEYIQATSRVGRQNVPGLIVTLYNNSKIRDRSHYESFATWHQSLYRELEGSSVTPFAARARDKALHAPLVVLSQHMIPELLNNPVLKPDVREKIENLVIPYILSRLKNICERELHDTKQQLKQILDDWEYRDGLKHYWSGKKNSLLVSADDVAQVYAACSKKSEGIATPNSMRNVEAQTIFFLKEYSTHFQQKATNQDGEK